MATTASLNPALKRAVLTAFVQTAGMLLLLLTVLGGGRVLRLGAISALGFWFGVLALVARRGPGHPSTSDALFVYWGTPVLMFAAVAVASAIGR
jgi:hypothetical protein